MADQNEREALVQRLQKHEKLAREDAALTHYEGAAEYCLKLADALKEAADALAQPVPVAVPEGWRIQRNAGGEIAVECDALAMSVLVEQDANAPRTLPEEALWALCDALLSASPQPAQQPAPEQRPAGGVRTGWPAEGRLMQDDSRQLSQALARDPAARLHAREAARSATPPAAVEPPSDEELDALMPPASPVYFSRHKWLTKHQCRQAMRAALAKFGGRNG